MPETSVLLRCRSCKTVNRVPTDRLPQMPKCGKCKSELQFPSRPVEVDDSNFREEVINCPGTALVFFWAPWCAHCRGMFPILEELAPRRAGIIKVALVNTEKAVNLARTFSIMSVPRLSLYRHGRLVEELNGAVSKPQLEEWLSYSMAR